MGRLMFDSKLFDTWLNSRVEKILPRMEDGNLTNEDMITLLLKAQTNHIHHMDDEFRSEFKAIKNEFKDVRNEIKDIRNEIKDLKSEFRISMRWHMGIVIALISGIYLKMFI